MQYSEREHSDVAAGLYYSLLGCMSDILYRWNIIFCGNSLRLGEKAACVQVFSVRDFKLKVTSRQTGSALAGIEAV
jgi:hypothetical protein